MSSPGAPDPVRPAAPPVAAPATPPAGGAAAAGPAARAFVPGAASWKRKAAGFALLVLGVLGVVLPILQGTLFLALGLFVLRDQYPWAHRWMEKLRARFPGLMDRVEGAEARLVAWTRARGAWLTRVFRPPG